MSQQNRACLGHFYKTTETIDQTNKSYLGQWLGLFFLSIGSTQGMPSANSLRAECPGLNNYAWRHHAAIASPHRSVIGYLKIDDVTLILKSGCTTIPGCFCLTYTALVQLLYFRGTRAHSLGHPSAKVDILLACILHIDKDHYLYKWQ